VLYIIFTTGQCNLRCKYCGGSFPENVVPWRVKYRIKDLERFMLGDDEPIICFYGGEPLLNSRFIKVVMERFSDAKFVMQTNGILIRRLEPKYWLRFDTVLLSIDGRKEITDYYRGFGVYDKVIEAAKWLRMIGFNGDLIARMTISEHSDIYKDVTHLLSLNLFNHIHWQLDVIWSQRWRDFDKWCDNSYIPGLRRLIRMWLDKAENGVVLGIVPIIGILSVMIKGGVIDQPPCGAGLNSVAISTDGTILACPIAVDVEWAKLGNLAEHDRESVLGKIRIGEPCTSCPYLKYCGGRCLYAHMERLWGEDGFRKVCRLTISLIDELMSIRDHVLRLIRDGVISEEQITYPPFNNTTEIVP